MGRRQGNAHGRRKADVVVRSVAIALIVIGASMLLYNGYQWWDQIRVAVHDPELAMSIATTGMTGTGRSPQAVDTDWKPGSARRSAVDHPHRGDPSHISGDRRGGQGPAITGWEPCFPGDRTCGPLRRGTVFRAGN